MKETTILPALTQKSPCRFIQCAALKRQYVSPLQGFFPFRVYHFLSSCLPTYSIADKPSSPDRHGIGKLLFRLVILAFSSKFPFGHKARQLPRGSLPYSSISDWPVEALVYLAYSNLAGDQCFSLLSSQVSGAINRAHGFLNLPCCISSAPRARAHFLPFSGIGVHWSNQRRIRKYDVVLKTRIFQYLHCPC